MIWRWFGHFSIRLLAWLIYSLVNHFSFVTKRFSKFRSSLNNFCFTEGLLSIRFHEYSSLSISIFINTSGSSLLSEIWCMKFLIVSSANDRICAKSMSLNSFNISWWFEFPIWSINLHSLLLKGIQYQFWVDYLEHNLQIPLPLLRSPRSLIRH